MTLSVPFRAALSGLILAAVSAHAQSSKPAVNQGPYQPQAQASTFGGKVVEDVVARVNDQIITSSDYQRAAEQMDTDGRQQGWSEQELADRKKTLLRDLIDKELLLSKGKQLDITGETELIKRLDEIRKQNHLDSMEDLEKAAQQQGVSYEDFKQNIRNEIVSQEVIRNEVSRHIQLTKAQVDEFYKQHKSAFEQPEAVHLDEILIPVDGTDEAALAKAQAKAAEVEAKLKAGTSFDELARQDSSGPTAQTGGDLGDFKRGMLAKPLEDAAFALKAGQVTAPIRTKQGLLILKVTQHVGGASQDFSAIEPQVEEAAFMDRMQPALRAYLTTLREQAYIDIRPGYVDAGAAAHSVKPLYSAYTAPGQKKKKKVKRERFGEAAFRQKGKTPAAPAPKPVASAPAAATTTTTTEAAATPAALPAPAPAPKPAQVAKNVPSDKPVKKQKIRFGQAPQETLAATPGSSAVSTTETTAQGETQVAAADIPEAAPAPPKVKTRFSGRRKKGPTQDQLENQAIGQATPEEQAAQKEQSSALGLAGDTTKKTRQPKPKTGEKTRYADDSKPKPETQPVVGDPGTAVPATTPPATTPAPQ